MSKLLDLSNKTSAAPVEPTYGYQLHSIDYATLAVLELYAESNLVCYRPSLIKTCQKLFPSLSAQKFYPTVRNLAQHGWLELVGTYAKDPTLVRLLDKSTSVSAAWKLKEIAPKLYSNLPTLAKFLLVVADPVAMLTDNQNQVGKVNSQQEVTNSLDALNKLYAELSQQHQYLQLQVNRLEKHVCTNSHLVVGAPKTLIGTGYLVKLTSNLNDLNALCYFEFDVTTYELSNLSFTVDQALAATEYLAVGVEITQALKELLLDEIGNDCRDPNLELR